ncbi:MAG: hypothetical protein J6K95_06740 [Rikenellaceae bacterium]|nr:hypothetical protein [Rikenellaceae bacterium]
MKRLKRTAAVCVAVAALCCPPVPAAARGGDGWHEMSGKMEETTPGRRVLRMRDCRALSIDSMRVDTVTVYEIVCRVAARKTAAWAGITERSIGRSLGFVYGGKVVCRPFVHMRVESGRFSVTGTDGRLMRSLYEAMDKRGE